MHDTSHKCRISKRASRFLLYKRSVTDVINQSQNSINVRPCLRTTGQMVADHRLRTAALEDLAGSRRDFRYVRTFRAADNY